MSNIPKICQLCTPDSLLASYKDLEGSNPDKLYYGFKTEIPGIDLSKTSIDENMKDIFIDLIAESCHDCPLRKNGSCLPDIVIIPGKNFLILSPNPQPDILTITFQDEITYHLLKPQSQISYKKLPLAA